MSDFITGSICMSTLIEKMKQGHSAFTKSPKDGKVYIQYVEWVNDEPNEFGKHSSIMLGSSKEKKEAEGKVYIGNGKKFESKPVTQADVPQDGWDANIPVRESKPTTDVPAADAAPPMDDLPF